LRGTRVDCIADAPNVDNRNEMVTKVAPTTKQIIANFLTEPEGKRSSEEPSETATRIVWLLFTLLLYDRVDATSYVRMFRVSERTFRRDVRRLQQIGRVCGFRLGPLKHGAVCLASRDIRLQPLLRGSRKLLELVRAIAEALGGPVMEVLGSSLETKQNSGPAFLRICAPRLVEGSSTGKIFTVLQNAHENRARVCFRYLASDDTMIDREVEPYGVIWNAGRFYLIAYDCSPRRAWRQFALDRIRGPLRRSGTFSSRLVPARYLSNDAVGLFKGENMNDVTIELNANIAPAVTCRLWQTAQRVKQLSNGRASITFSVGDIKEAVRWAMSFGSDARVVHPPEAVRAARTIAEELATRYSMQVVTPVPKSA
jgi:predicted DNA-binding transcriptional regulator YafY